MKELVEQGVTPAGAMGDRGFFDGIFDIDGDGDPEIFLDYWHSSDDTITLVVFKKYENAYREYLRLSAPTEGYYSGAWFLDERPFRKAVFRSRCGGSSGPCLWFLNLKKRSLDPITDDIEGEPIFEDIDDDGQAEIFVPARGRDRTASQGAGLFHWNGASYQLWWPQWHSPPYVVYARMQDLDEKAPNDIVAVIDPKGDSRLRELEVWKLSAQAWKLQSKIALPQEPDDHLVTPYLRSVAGDARDAIILDDGADGLLRCTYHAGSLVCPPSPPGKQ
jgi:hypothetical protein